MFEVGDKITLLEIVQTPRFWFSLLVVCSLSLMVVGTISVRILSHRHRFLSHSDPDQDCSPIWNPPHPSQA